MSPPATASNMLEEETQLAAAEPPDTDGCRAQPTIKVDASDAIKDVLSDVPRSRSNSLDSCASSARSDDGKGYEEDHEGEDDDDEIPSLPLIQPVPSRPVSCVRAPCLKRNPNSTLAVDSGAESAASASPAFGASACSSLAGSLLLPPAVAMASSAVPSSSAIPSSFAAPRSFNPSSTTLRSLTPLSTITGPSLTTASANANFDANIALPLSASSSNSCLADVSTGALSATSLRSLSFSSACSASRHVRFDSGPPEAGVTHSGKHYDRRPIETTHGTGSDLDLSLTRCSTLHDDAADGDDATTADDASTRDEDEEANAQSDDAIDGDDDEQERNDVRAALSARHGRSASADEAEASSGDEEGRSARRDRKKDVQRRRSASADDGDTSDERYLHFARWAQGHTFQQRAQDEANGEDGLDEDLTSAHREELERITSGSVFNGDGSASSSRRSSSSSSGGDWSAPRVMRVVQSGLALAPAQTILGHGAASSSDPTQAALPVHGIRAFGGLASAAGSTSPSSADAWGNFGRRRKRIPPLVEGRKVGLHDPSWDDSDEEAGEDSIDAAHGRSDQGGSAKRVDPNDDGDEQEILQDEERNVPPRTTSSPFSEAMSRLGGTGAYGSSRRSPNATPKPSPSVRPRWEKVCGYFEVAPVADASEEEAAVASETLAATTHAPSAALPSVSESLTVEIGRATEPAELLSSKASLSKLSPAVVSPFSSPTPSDPASLSPDPASSVSPRVANEGSVSPLGSQASSSDIGAAATWNWNTSAGVAASTADRERLSVANTAQGSSSSGEDSAGSSTVDSLLMQEHRASRASRPSNLGHGSRSASAVSELSTTSSSSATHSSLQQPQWRLPDATGSGLRSPRSPCEMSASDGLCSSAATSPELGPVGSPRGKTGLSMVSGVEDEDSEERRCFLSPGALSSIWSGGNFVKSNRLASGDSVGFEAVKTAAHGGESPLSSSSPNDESNGGAGNLVEIPCLSPDKLLPPSLLASRRRHAQISRSLAAAAAVAAGCGAQVASSSTASASASPSLGGTPLTGTSASASASGMTSDESPALSETEGLPLPPQQSSEDYSPLMSDDKLLAPPTPMASAMKKKRSSSRREGSSGSSSRDKEGRRSASSSEVRGPSSSTSSGKPRRSSMGSAGKTSSSKLERSGASSFFGSCSGFDEGALGGF